MIRRMLLVAVGAGLLGQSSVRAQIAVYDGLTGLSTVTTTGSVPHTYMGQAFSVADPGGGAPVHISKLEVIMFYIGAAASYADTKLNVQFWGTYDPTATGTSVVFSNPIGGVQSQNTGPFNPAGTALKDFVFNFSPTIDLPSLTNLGITLNWQSSTDGVTFVDDTNFASGLRTGAGGTVPPPALAAGANLNPGGGYFRNASGLTTFNFQAGQARQVNGRAEIEDEVLQCGAGRVERPPCSETAHPRSGSRIPRTCPSPSAVSAPELDVQFGVFAVRGRGTNVKHNHFEL